MADLYPPRETNVQHLFFFLSGILAGQWVIGGDVVHSLYAVGFTKLFLFLFRTEMKYHYSITSSWWILFLPYGYNTHLLQVLATYLILLCAGGTLVSVVVSFLFNFGYLLVGIIYDVLPQQIKSRWGMFTQRLKVTTSVGPCPTVSSR